MTTPLVPYPSFVHQRPVATIGHGGGGGDIPTAIAATESAPSTIQHGEPPKSLSSPATTTPPPTTSQVATAAATAVAMSAVGRCRIYPESCTIPPPSRHKNSNNEDNDDDDDDVAAEEYLAIVAKNVLQAQVDTMSDDELEEVATAITAGAAVAPTPTSSSTSSKPSSSLCISKDKLKKRLMKEGVAMARGYLQDTLQLDPSIVDVEIFVRDEDLIDTQGCLASCWLDAGCSAIVANGYNVHAMEICQIPRERLMAHFVVDDVAALQDTTSSSIGNDDGTTSNTNETNDHTLILQAIQKASKWAFCISIEFKHHQHISVDDVTSWIQQIATTIQQHSNDDDDNNNKVEPIQLVFQIHPLQVATTTTKEKDHVSAATSSRDDQLAKWIAAVHRKFKPYHKTIMGTVSLMDPTPTQLGLAYVTASCTTDRKDQLYTTVVCTRNGEALGLVYSSVESIIAALECGRGVYYSRSRKGLWRKGDTSGNYQTLHRIDVDCDGDALRFTVTQRGGAATAPAFCHLNTLTCWGPPHGLRHLEETLQQRIIDAPAGSYTKRLFDDDELLRNKLVEEAQELAEADNKEDVASELADVLYFAMVRAIKAGVSIDDAVQELDRRARKVTRRPGDSKTFRIEAGNAILHHIQQQQEQQPPKDKNDKNEP